jgi:hypothetical protein
MQIVTPSWSVEALIPPYYPGYLPLRSDTFGGALPRCRRCDILLGPELCPNPECCTPHGASVGDLCTWCSHEV